MTFNFAWVNPSSYYQVINAKSYIELQGVCSVIRHGGFWPGNSSRLTIRSDLQLLGCWTDPPTLLVGSSPLLTDPDRAYYQGHLVNLYLGPGGYLDGEETYPANPAVLQGCNLEYDLCLIPPGGIVVFQISSGIEGEVYDGQVIADFNYDGYQISCPSVTIEVVTAPSMSAPYMSLF